MVRVLCLSRDSKFTSDIGPWLKESGAEIDFVLHPSIDALLEADVQPEEARGPPESTEPLPEKQTPLSRDELYRCLGQFQIVLLDFDILAEKNWRTELAFLKFQTLNARKNQTEPKLRVQIMGFIQGKDPWSIQGMWLDDLMTKPADRLLFLQKIGRLLGRAGVNSPSFLFESPIKMKFELGKEVQVLELSEDRIVVLNPVKLKAGLKARVRMDFEDGSILKTEVKLIRNVPNSDGTFETHFAFFAPDHDTTQRIRRYIKSRKPKASTWESKGSQPGTLNIAFIDSRSDRQEKTKEFLKRIMPSVSLTGFSSYSAYLRSQGDKKAEEDNLFRELFASNPPPPIEPRSEDGAEPPRQWLEEPVTGILDLDSLSFKSPDEHLRTISAVTDPIDQPELEEFFQIAKSQSSRELESAFVLLDPSQARVPCHFRIKSDGEIVELTLQRAGRDDWLRLRLPSAAAASGLKFDTILAAHDIWAPSVPTQAEQNVILLSSQPADDARNRVEQDFWNIVDVERDRRALVFALKHLGEALGQEIPIADPEWISQSVRLHKLGIVAQEFDTESVSEAGLSIKRSEMLRNGAILHLHSDLLHKQAGVDELRGLMGQVIESKQEESGDWICKVQFLGTPDQLAKHIRSEIRSGYVHEKQKAAE